MRTHLLPLFAAFSLALLSACGGEAHSDAAATGPAGRWQLDVEATHVALGKDYEPEKARRRAQERVQRLDRLIADTKAKLKDLRERQAKDRAPESWEEEIAEQDQWLEEETAERETWKARVEDPYVHERAFRIDLREDGVATVRHFRGEEVGTWTREGEAIRIAIPASKGSKKMDVFEGTLEGDRLTVRTEEGQAFVMERAR
ncbi:MAG: hypothetical protein QNJ98_07735 [Planctomycetota bacterium]|nr:hypothetical protein [Planctomycetota bacterium]